MALNLNRTLLSAKELDNLQVVLVSTRNPLNIGATARAMSNFGFQRLRVVNPYELAFREARSAVGAAPLLRRAEEFTSVAEAVADCSLVIGTTAARNRELRHRLRTLEHGSRFIRRALARSRVAVLFGSEKRGLSNDDLSYCQWLMRIPTDEEHSSMNLGQAAAVCLYEISRARSVPEKRETAATAKAAELERIGIAFAEALKASGYFGDAPGSSRLQDLRRFVRRLELDHSDAELLLGMLRQISWKLKKE